MKKGFTLVEVISVIAVIAIMLLIAMPTMRSLYKSRQADTMLIDAKTIIREIQYEGKTFTTTTLENLGLENITYDNYEASLSEAYIENDTIHVNLVGKGIFKDMYLCGVTVSTKTANVQSYNCTTTPDDGTVPEVTQTASEEIIAKYNNGTNSEGLMLVNTNEYRYSGSTVKNYVNFNNETWRIVGIFNGRIKLMRDAVLGSAKWDSTSPYSNAWEGSEIEVGLNGNYLTSTGYLGSSLSSASQNLIDDATWYVTPITYSQDTASAYAAERPSSNAVTYEGKVGLINPSDYGYASSSCYNDSTKLLYSSTQANSYHSDTCKNANWMYENMSSTVWWTIAPYSGNSNNALTVYTTGLVDYGNVRNSVGVRPSVYLKSGVKLASTSGDGSNASNAYVFEI